MITYNLEEVTLRTDNSEEGQEKIGAFWEDVLKGKLPLLFDNKGMPIETIFPLAKYSHYEKGADGLYNLTLLKGTIKTIEHLEVQLEQRIFKKFTGVGKTSQEAAVDAWKTVWQAQENNTLSRAYLEDYEWLLPKEGQFLCTLYISVI